MRGLMIMFSSPLLLSQQHCSLWKTQNINHITDQSVSLWSQSLWCCDAAVTLFWRPLWHHRSRLRVDCLLARCWCGVGFTCCRSAVGCQCPWGAEWEKKLVVGGLIRQHSKIFISGCVLDFFYLPSMKCKNSLKPTDYDTSYFSNKGDN